MAACLSIGSVIVYRKGRPVLESGSSTLQRRAAACFSMYMNEVMNGFIAVLMYFYRAVFNFKLIFKQSFSRGFSNMGGLKMIFLLKFVWQ